MSSSPAFSLSGVYSFLHRTPDFVALHQAFTLFSGEPFGQKTSGFTVSFSTPTPRRCIVTKKIVVFSFTPISSILRLRFLA